MKKSAKQEYNGLFEDEDDADDIGTMYVFIAASLFFLFYLFTCYITSHTEDDDDTVRPLTSNEARNLAHYLKVKVLPGLNESERIHLIAMVDTIVEVS